MWLNVTASHQRHRTCAGNMVDPDAGRATIDATAGSKPLDGGGEGGIKHGDKTLGQARSTGIAVIDEDVGSQEMRIADPPRESQVAGIAHKEDWRYIPYQLASRSQQGGLACLWKPGQQRTGSGTGIENKCNCTRLHLLRRQVDLTIADVLVGMETELLELLGLAADQDIAEGIASSSLP